MTTPGPQQIAIRAIICLSVLILAGCASKTPKPPPTPPPAPEVRPEVSETAYSVQLGAFSVLKNAVSLARSLRDTGLEAYYFKHESGLYKVRIGDFATRADALARAEDLAARDVVEEFWVVGPEDYALARSRIYGSGMLREELIRTAENFIGLPYQWGGSSPDQGFDCSGLTMAVYQLNGLNIPRSSRDQFSRGRPIRREELHKGDLVFFATKSSRRKVSHVGVYAGNGRFIHAPGTGKTIRTDTLSNPYFSRCYVGARTYL